MIGIYKITSPVGKIYIGQSTNIDKRFNQYKMLSCKNQIKLYRSFNKHGVLNHIFEVIEECSINDLNKKERYWQEFYNVISVNGLNLILTKDDNYKNKFSKSTRIKMSRSQKKRIKSKNSNSFAGKKGKENHMFNKCGPLHHNYGKIFTIDEKAIASKNSIGNNSRSKKVINEITGVIYISAEKAAKEIGIKPKTLRAKLSGQNINNTNLKYYKMNENNEMIFGVPNLRGKKEEKYPDTAVLTFEATAEGLGRKASFNDKAMEVLGLDETNDQVSFSFSGKDVFVANTSGTEQGKAGIKIGKTTQGFSDKKHYEAIKTKNFASPDTDGLELELISTGNSFNGHPVLQLVQFKGGITASSTSDSPVAPSATHETPEVIEVAPASDDIVATYPEATMNDEETADSIMEEVKAEFELEEAPLSEENAFVEEEPVFSENENFDFDEK